MARVIPIKGLDSDLEKVVNDLKSAIEKRNHLNDYIDALTKMQDVYMKIKILAGTLGFSVKEIEFSEKTISNLDILFKNSNMDDADAKQYEKDKNIYLEKMNLAQMQVINKSKELDNQINLLLELKDHVKENLADKDFSSIDNILKSLDMFVDALDLKSVVEKAIKDQKTVKEDVQEETQSEDNSENDDFTSLNDIVSEGEMMQVKEDKKEDKKVNKDEINTEEEKKQQIGGKKILSISNINPTISKILHPESKPFVEDNVEIFSNNNGPVIPPMDNNIVNPFPNN